MVVRFLLGLAICALLFGFVSEYSPTPSYVCNNDCYNVPLGVSFSARQARSLGLDPEETLEALLQIGVHHVRLAAYWDEIEREPGKYDFTQLDRELELVAHYRGKATIVVGLKNFRWPEFYPPDHIEVSFKDGIATLSSEANSALFRYIETTVARYRGHEALIIWQVENEPFEPTGPNKGRLSFEMLAQEVAQVKKLDSVHPVMLTASGTRGPERTWDQPLSLGDILGVNIYFKFKYYKSLPWVKVYYWERTKTNTSDLVEWTERAHAAGKKFVIAELQAEPWEKIPLYEITGPVKSSSPTQIESNVAFARKAPLDLAFLWGAEWWIRELVRGNSFWWEIAQKIFAENK